MSIKFKLHGVCAVIFIVALSYIGNFNTNTAIASDDQIIIVPPSDCWPNCPPPFFDTGINPSFNPNPIT